MLDRTLKKTFKKISRLYDEVRPGYPEEAIATFIGKGHLLHGSKILDVGCGSGQMAIPLVQRGFKVTAIDLSKELIDIAREKTKTIPNIQFFVTEFEKAQFTDSFEAIIFPQSFHWIDEKIALPRTYSLLKPHGVAIFIWNFFDFKKSDFTLKLTELFERLCPDHVTSVHAQTGDLKKQLKNFRKFHQVEDFRFEWKLPYSKPDFIKLLDTFSFVSSLQAHAKSLFDEQLNILFKTVNEPLHIPYETILFLAYKV